MFCFGRSSRVLHGAVLCVGCLVVVFGCSQPSPYVSPRSRPLPDAPATTFQTDLDALDDALAWALRDLGWAQIRKVHEVSALHASALIDDGRTVEIRAQKVSPTRCAVQVRVGHVTDEAYEQMLISRLEFRLADRR